MRLNNIVLTNMVNKRLVAYEELERAMNTKGPIDETVSKIQHYLEEISKLNGMITEWQTISSLETNGDNNNPKENITNNE